jgi:Uri superfamily endonuclease
VLRGRGTYTLLIICKRSFRVKIGSLGYVSVGEGYYLYTGSALGRGSVSLEGRLKRHFRASKKPKWHVDYLTLHRHCEVDSAVCLRSSRHLECRVNQAIARRLDVRAILPRAGSSDCKCEGHLLKVRSSTSARRILHSLKLIYEVFGEPVLVEGNCR